jgi:ribosome-binding protein aMBF1 (putative translation factor)
MSDWPDPNPLEPWPEPNSLDRKSPEPKPPQSLRELGAAIRDGRRQHGLTQMRLEALSGVDQSSISRLERGLAPGMKVYRLARILAVLPRSGLLEADRRRGHDIWG